MNDPAVDEARLLLALLADAVHDAKLRAEETATIARIQPDDDIARWADSGAMALSGQPDSAPLAPSAPVASRLVGAAAVLAQLTATGGVAVEVDAPALLGERAALGRRDGGDGLGHRGGISTGGGCRLLPVADGWVAVTLNRDDDWALVPAWLGSIGADRQAAGAGRPAWDAIATGVAGQTSAAATTAAAELGLAVAAVPAGDRPDDEQWRFRTEVSDADAPWLITPTTDPRTARGLPTRVLDLSALWAGPLCASLLRLAGAEVVMVESAGRPDGARVGDPGLYELLHAGHDVVALDLRDRAGRDELRRLVDAADVVVTAARPRALEQLGLDPAAEVAGRPGLTWVAVTGYGATGPWRDRIAYGDDAAVAGGLVVMAPAGETSGDTAPVPPPLFCADAVADPSTGLFAAIAALAVGRAGGGVVDVALRDVAAHLARPPAVAGPRTAVRSDGRWVVRTAGREVPVRQPRARSPLPARQVPA